MDELEGVSSTGSPDGISILSVLRQAIETQSNGNTEDGSSKIEASVSFSHENDMAIKSNLDPDLTMQTAALFVERIMADADNFYNAQANVEPENALALLQN